MSTKKATKKAMTDEIRDDYDLSGGVRGKFFAEYQEGTNIVVLDPDVAKEFPSSESVNRALRQVLSERRVRRKTSKRSAG